LYVKDGSVTFWSKTERGIKAELRLQHHPYDTESWGVLIREAQVELQICYVFETNCNKNLGPCLKTSQHHQVINIKLLKS